MVVTEVRATHVPMEVFCFQVKRKSICKDRIHRPDDVFCSRRGKIGRRNQGSFLPALEVLLLQFCDSWLHDCGPCWLVRVSETSNAAAGGAVNVDRFLRRR